MTLSTGPDDWECWWGRRRDRIRCGNCLMRGARIAFLREVSDPAETREVFVEMVRQARQG